MKKKLLLLFILIFVFSGVVAADSVGIQYGNFSVKDTDIDMNTLILEADWTFRSGLYNELRAGFGSDDNYDATIIDWRLYNPVKQGKNEFYVGTGIKYIYQKQEILWFDIDASGYALPFSALFRSKLTPKTIFKFKAELLAFGQYSADSDFGGDLDGDFNGWGIDMNIQQELSEQVNLVLGYANDDYSFDGDGEISDFDGGFDGFYAGCNISF
ncbi:hypothetical protein [Halocella sp. SP3-1]|uniref:hypothetical protein n=1 Tax=Halocella sp. SP3-1 TaxID=2382161 RepID=UPI000F758210|nr:hypothetical protein [Halocella sp. SP3-1]AZO96113.1 hypothetical protein D7D81_16785 [Halocella sp. SP3-1]